MGKIVLGNLLRHLITAGISFIAAKHIMSADVAAKLMAGDTVSLWSGGWTFSLADIINFVSLSIIPIMVPVLLGAWARIQDKYKLFIAALSPRTMSAEQLKDAVASASTAQIIRTVSTQS